jgi:hypothetical protein
MAGGAANDRKGPTGAGELVIGCGLAAALAYEAGWLSPLFSLSIAGLILVGGGLARERWLAMARRAGLWRGGQRAENRSIG